jgi:hypothetical protein
MDKLLMWAVAGCGILAGALLALVIGGTTGWVVGAGVAAAIIVIGSRIRRRRTDEVLKKRLRRSV